MTREPTANAARPSRRRILASATTAVVVLFGLTAYDAAGAYQARQFAAENIADPVAIRDNLVRYHFWHPTRNVFHWSGARAEAVELRDLDKRIAGQRYALRLRELTRQASDADADPESVWRLYRNLRDDFTDQECDADLERLRETVRARRDAARERAARSALADLDHAEAQADPPTLIEQADRFLREHGDTTLAADVQKRRQNYVQRLDERDIESARDYSAREPLSFHTRRERYRQYLERHTEGAFVSEAKAAIDAIAVDWDRHDYRAVRDHFRDHPADVQELQARGRSYLAAHGQGQFREAVAGLLRWAERAAEPADYRVVLRSGHFERRIAWLLSRGPDLSVEIEVNGARYGPSNIVANRYDPVWDYEFPRRIRWKLGDPVRIRVYDHDYYKRLVLNVHSEANDALAFWMLSGEVLVGDNSLTFESDFRLPDLPPAE